MTATALRRVTKSRPATAPVALVSLVAVDDPVFAIIERSRQAEARVRAIYATIREGASFEEALPIEERAMAEMHKCDDALAELAAARPTTVAGCIALLRYIQIIEDRYDSRKDYGLFCYCGDHVSGPASDMLSRIADALERAVA